MWKLLFIKGKETSFPKGECKKHMRRFTAFLGAQLTGLAEGLKARLTRLPSPCGFYLLTIKLCKAKSPGYTGNQLVSATPKDKHPREETNWITSPQRSQVAQSSANTSSYLSPNVCSTSPLLCKLSPTPKHLQGTTLQSAKPCWLELLGVVAQNNRMADVSHSE